MFEPVIFGGSQLVGVLQHGPLRTDPKVGPKLGFLMYSIWVVIKIIVPFGVLV